MFMTGVKDGERSDVNTPVKSKVGSVDLKASIESKVQQADLDGVVVNGQHKAEMSVTHDAIDANRSNMSPLELNKDVLDVQT